MPGKSDVHRRQSIHVSVERSTLAIVVVCFLLFNVVVFAGGYVTGVSAEQRETDRAESRRALESPFLRSEPDAVRPAAPVFGDSARLSARVDTVMYATPPRFAYMNLSDLYRALVQQGGSVDDLLEPGADTTRLESTSYPDQ